MCIVAGKIIVRQKLSIAERWQAVGIKQQKGGTVCWFAPFCVDRLMDRFQATGTVEDRRRSGRPGKTTPREDRLIARRVRRDNFTTAGRIRTGLPFGDHH